MKILALFLAFMISVALLILLKVHIEARYCLKDLESTLYLNIRILTARIRIDIRIPKEMLTTGFLNVMVNAGDQPQHCEVNKTEDIQRKTKTQRYRAVTKIGRRILHRYIFSWSRFLYLKNALFKLYHRFYRKIQVHKLQAEVAFGTGDAAYTALLAGGIWGMFGYLKARLFKLVTIKEDHVKYSVIPQFDGEMLFCKLHCIFSLKISHIIFTAYQFLVVILKLRRIRNYG